MISRSTHAVAAASFVALASGTLVAAADSQAIPDAIYANCIQEAMVRGAVGERLKAYVDSCVKTKRDALPPQMKPEATDTTAC